MRCWREGSGDEAGELRGTVRDLARGRAAAFDGLAALFTLLSATLLGDDMVVLASENGDDTTDINLS